MFVDLATLAATLDIGERRVQQLANEGLIPKPDSRGEYDLVGCVRGYIARLKEEKRPKAESEQEQLLREQKIRLTTAQADTAELDLETKRGKLLVADEVELAWSGAVLRCRQRMLGLPATVAPLVVGKKNAVEIETVISDYIHEALVELSTIEEPAVAGGAEEVPSEAGAAEKTDRKPVGRRKPKAKQRVKRRAGKVAN